MGKNGVEKMMRVVFYSSFDAGELRRYVQGVEDCECISVEKNKDGMGNKSFVRKSVIRESSSSAFSRALYKKIRSVLREEMSSRHSGSFF